MKRKILWPVAIGCLIVALLIIGLFIATLLNRVIHYGFKNGDGDRVAIAGIDVSANQGEIDWTKVKDDGVEFAIIRAGYTGFSTGMENGDKRFEENMKGAKDNGILTGVYYYSQALTVEEAIHEADYCAKLLKKAGYRPKDLDLPVYMDYEFSPQSNNTRRFVEGTLTKDQATEIALAWMSEMSKKGYDTGIYANVYFLNHIVEGSEIGAQYPVWAAHYADAINYSGSYHMWQYSDSGKVDGITKNYVDLDYLYFSKDAPETTSYSIAGCEVGFKDQVLTDTPKVEVKPEGSMRYLRREKDFTVLYLDTETKGKKLAIVIGKGKYSDYKVIPYTVGNQTS